MNKKEELEMAVRQRGKRLSVLREMIMENKLEAAYRLSEAEREGGQFAPFEKNC